jgi:cytochrome c oxidase assembly protein subunit 15
MLNSTPTSYRWPHRLALLSAVVTFPLIWVGGLVTSYDAGMAVPDWPSTYGYNLFLYPPTTWFFGPWDLFIEHGHRLLGALAGMLMISLVAVTLLAKCPRWLIQFAFALLVLVILQGVLGGIRVRLDDRMFALLHGCTGPLFFVLLVAFAVVTSPKFAGTELPAKQTSQRLTTAAWGFAAVCYLQLVLGALVRHVPVTSSAGFFRAVVLLHIVMALVLLAQALLLSGKVLFGPDRSVSRWVGVLLSLLIVVQVSLGAATWIVKYGWPDWMGSFQFAAEHLNYEKSALQAVVSTAHVANGSLILATAVILSLQASRHWRPAVAMAAPLLFVRTA